MATICLISGQTRFLQEINNALSFQYVTHCFSDVTNGLLAAKKYDFAAVLVTLPDLLAMGDSRIAQIPADQKLSQMPIIVVGEDMETQFYRMNLPLPNAVYLQKPFLKSELLDLFTKQISSSVQRQWNRLEKRPREVLNKTLEVFTDWQSAVDGGVPINMEATAKSCEPLVDAINNHDVVSILDSVKMHHDYTYVHSMRVATYLSVFAHAVGLRDEQLQLVATGGLLHDVGKISTPDDILNKPGRLEGDEWETMKDHVVQSGEILKRNDTISAGIRVIAEQHHEKIDGSGYPKGLKGAELSELARMSTIADIFSALTDERTYKKAFSTEKAFGILDEMGGQLDQKLVGIFQDVIYAEFYDGDVNRPKSKDA